MTDVERFFALIALTGLLGLLIVGILWITIPPAKASVPTTCEGKLAQARQQSDGWFEAYQETVGFIETARPLVRQQILTWRHEGKTWTWIKNNPVGKAFYGPLQYTYTNDK